jgi:hypothetical protein
VHASIHPCRSLVSVPSITPTQLTKADPSRNSNMYHSRSQSLRQRSQFSHNHPVQPQSHHPLRPHCIKRKRKSHTCESPAALTVEVGPPASSSCTHVCRRVHCPQQPCMIHNMLRTTSILPLHKHCSFQPCQKPSFRPASAQCLPAT